MGRVSLSDRWGDVEWGPGVGEEEAEAGGATTCGTARQGPTGDGTGRNPVAGAYATVTCGPSESRDGGQRRSRSGGASPDGQTPRVPVRLGLV